MAATPEACSAREILRNVSGETRTNGTPARFDWRTNFLANGAVRSFAVKQRLDRKPAINGGYEVAHAFNEEEPMLVSIATVVLEFPNSSESGSSV